MKAIIISSEQFEELLGQIEQLNNVIAQQRHKIFDQLYLNNNQLAKMLGVSKRTLQNWRDKGLIAFSQIGNKIFYRAEDVEMLMKENRNPRF